MYNGVSGGQAENREMSRARKIMRPRIDIERIRESKFNFVVLE